jgi:hypothetical protein
MMRASPSHRRLTRAFTLIEVLMALSAGVLVSLATLLLSKNATLLFQHESRVSAAQLAVTLGLNRITADLQRASFLSSMNPRLDPRVCKDPSWGMGMNGLAGIVLTPGDPNFPTLQSAANGLAPEQVTISGSLDADDYFEVQNVQSGAGGPLLVFRSGTTEPATLRALATAPGATSAQALQCNFFMPPAPCLPPGGRLAHIYDPIRDFHYYSLIQGVTSDASNTVSVQLVNTIQIPLKANSYCGVGSYDTPGVRWLMSVVSNVKYAVRNIAANPAYAGLVSKSLNTPQGANVDMSAITGDDARTELIRVELDPVTGAEVANTLEVISEYAVDLRFGITAQASITQGNLFAPTMTTTSIVPAPGPNSPVYTTPPQAIRSVQVRLATRSRTPDRVMPMPYPALVAPFADGRLLHFWLPLPGCPGAGQIPQPDQQTQCYTRVRTGYANVTLPNQGGFWQW